MRFIDVKLSPVEGNKNDNCRRHALFVESIFLETTTFKYDSTLPHDDNYISALIDGSLVAFVLKVVVDDELVVNPKDFDVVFQLYGPPSVYETFYPFSPPSYCTQDEGSGWATYKQLCELPYKPRDDMQPFTYLGIGEHWSYSRKRVRSLLGYTPELKSFKDFLSQIVGHKAFIGAPGIMPFMIDRSVIQMLSLGCCVIHPKISYPLPDGGLLPGVHYLQCADDYSDLHDVLRTPAWQMKQIGERAKRYFKRWLTPRPLMEYIRATISERYDNLESIRLGPTTLRILDKQARYIRHIERYRFARIHAHGVVVDYGAGCGYGSEILRFSPLVEKIIKLEIDESVVKWGERNYGAFNEPVEHCDTLVAFEILEHQKDNDPFLEIVKKLTPKTIILSYPRDGNKHLCKWHLRDINEPFSIPGYSRVSVQVVEDSKVEVHKR